MLKMKVTKAPNVKETSMPVLLYRIVSLQAIRKLIIFSMIICGLTSVKAQNEAKVLEASVKTSDSILIQTFAPKTVIKGKSISIDYIVSNQSGRNVYLVVDPVFTDVKVRENLIFDVIEPVVGPDDHHPFNYKFIKIRPKGKYKGIVVLSAEDIASSGLQNLSSATIRIGFSYLFDISKLVACKQTSYRLPCLSELYDKSKSLTIGNLVIGIKKP